MAVRDLPVALVLSVAAMLLVFPVSSSAAGPRPDFELPFPCGQQWRLDSWGHAPALDMVKEPNQVGTEGAALVAPASGTVNMSFFHSNAGNTIQIDHGGDWFTTYIHLQSRAVSVGEHVSQGELIGRVGRTGPTSNNHPHLHYELGVDANGDGRASWGSAGSERVPAWFHGVRYGTANGQTYRNVTSHNCGATNYGMDVSSWGEGRMDVFVRGSDDRLKHKWFDNGSWSPGWEDLGGVLRSDPTAVSWGSGRIDVFARGRDNDLLHKWYERGVGWSAWERLQANLAYAPDVTSWREGRLDVFGTNPSGTLVHKTFADGSVSSWTRRGGNLVSGPTAVAPESGRFEVFGRSADGELMHKRLRDTGQWSSWYSRGGSLRSDPDAASWAPDRVDVFARDTNNDMAHKILRETGRWSSWYNRGGNLRSNVSVVSRFDGRLDLFARNKDDKLVHKYYVEGDSWTLFTPVDDMP